MKAHSTKTRCKKCGSLDIPMNLCICKKETCKICRLIREHYQDSQFRTKLVTVKKEVEEKLPSTPFLMTDGEYYCAPCDQYFLNRRTSAAAVRSHINTHKHVHMAALHLEKPCPQCYQTEINYSLCYAADCSCKICTSRKINDEKNRKEAKRIKLDSAHFEKQRIVEQRLELKKVEDELDKLRA